MSEFESLRAKAYRMLEKKKGERYSERFANEDLSKLLHELDVYQAELEAQNQELLEKEHEVGILYKKNKAVFENAPIAYFLVDDRFRVTYANNKAKEFFETDSDNFGPGSFYAYLARNEYRTFTDWIVSSAYRQRDLEIRLQAFHDIHGRWFKVSATDYPENDNWKIISLIDIDSEVRLREKSEERARELVRENADLEEKVQEQLEDIKKKDHALVQQSKMAAMGEMIGNIAHQWRQPLNSLSLLIVDLVTEENVDQNRLFEFEEKANSLLHQMSNTIDDFRKFFHPGKEKQQFSAVKTIQDTLSMVEKSMEARGIQVDFHSDDPEMMVLGYENELKQVLLNIINNSRDALVLNEKSDGKIALEIYRGQYRNIIITMQDNGGGIDKSIIDRVFEPYFTTKFEYEGTGIGLYMSKMIIEESMGGSLMIENKDDGVIAVISLPGAV